MSATCQVLRLQKRTQIVLLPLLFTAGLRLSCRKAALRFLPFLMNPMKFCFPPDWPDAPGKVSKWWRWPLWTAALSSLALPPRPRSFRAFHEAPRLLPTVLVGLCRTMCCWGQKVWVAFSPSAPAHPRIAVGPSPDLSMLNTDSAPQQRTLPGKRKTWLLIRGGPQP